VLLSLLFNAVVAGVLLAHARFAKKGGSYLPTRLLLPLLCVGLCTVVSVRTLQRETVAYCSILLLSHYGSRLSQVPMAFSALHNDAAKSDALTAMAL